MDSIQRNSQNGPATVPSQPITQPQQTLKIRRNTKKAKRATPTIDESEENSQPRRHQDESNERTEADSHFEELTRNLRKANNDQQNPASNIYIRRGSQYQTTKQ